MKREAKKDQEKIIVPDERDVSEFEGVSVSGDFGPTVVIKTGKSKTVNIGGGPSSGNAYRTFVTAGQPSVGSILDVLRGLDLPSRESQEIKGALLAIDQEISTNGDRSDFHYLVSLFGRIKNVSPDAAGRLLDWMGSSVSEVYRKLRQLA